MVVRTACPDRLVRNHRNCDRCDDDAVFTLGPDRALDLLSEERVAAAVARLTSEGSER